MHPFSPGQIFGKARQVPAFFSGGLGIEDIGRGLRACYGVILRQGVSPVAQNAP